MVFQIKKSILAQKYMPSFFMSKVFRTSRSLTSVFSQRESQSGVPDYKVNPSSEVRATLSTSKVFRISRCLTSVFSHRESQSGVPDYKVNPSSEVHAILLYVKGI